MKTRFLIPFTREDLEAWDTILYWSVYHPGSKFEYLGYRKKRKVLDLDKEKYLIKYRRWFRKPKVNYIWDLNAQLTCYNKKWMFIKKDMPRYIKLMDSIIQ